MSERRPQWDDDVIRAVTDAIDANFGDPLRTGTRSGLVVSRPAPAGPTPVSRECAPRTQSTRLAQIGRLHRPDPFGVRCVHCQWAWPCATRKLCDGT